MKFLWSNEGCIYKFSLRYLRVKLRPHAIRHSYAISMLKETKELETVRRLLGHSDYKWLKAYLNRIQEVLKNEPRRARLRGMSSEKYPLSL